MVIYYQCIYLIIARIFDKSLYFVNWQRDISIETMNGKKVIVKRNKPSKWFHEYLLIVAYSLISILLMHPSPPPVLGERSRRNEGFAMRIVLRKLGVPTPALLSISDEMIIEEYVPGGNLYRAFSHGKSIELSYDVGVLTGRLHNSGYSFVDNKSQNYLVSCTDSIVRTDLGFTQKNSSTFSRCMDIATFLASVIDLEQYTYLRIQKSFFKGYSGESKESIPYIWMILRNLLSLGFASDRILMIKNMLQ